MLALLLLVAGCGGRNAVADERPSTPPCTTPGFTDDAVRIGLIYPDSGPLASAFALARSGFEARIELANEAGGVHGRTVEVIWGDDRAQSATNLVVARRLVENRGIFAVAELTTAASGAADYLAQKAVPVVGLAAEPVWNDYDNMFAATYIYSAGASATTFGIFARAQGSTRVAVLEDPYAPTSQTLSGQMITSMSAQGVETVTRIPYRIGQSSATRAAQAIKASGADALVVSMPPDGLREILLAARRAGLGFRMVLSPVAYDKNMLAHDGQDFAGVYAYFAQIPWESRSPALAAYRDAMSRFAPEVTDPDQNIVLNSYISADMLVRGLEIGGRCPTRASFHAGLRALTDYDAAGLIPGGVDLSSNRGDLSRCFSFARVNPEGTGFQTLPSPGGTEQWCGAKISG
ncbi:amino acid/amide ABC transporter substrate-binding protein, HAAT family [Frankia sp. EI5c]|uniref:ABC transporter substrate-binding protein n=1 Tax=Frankia sp. EI5c TaxID=683316 RepID=UPI0007C202CC|nr:ABC transporter substrate-binding protein [Frankia sp. EI5c]OAA27723.1 amino acid/amide ABC transporter substrate-binding protein, HAAT family [Frankia sp. EI5c]